MAEFLPYLIRTPDDLRNDAILSAIDRIARSKFAIMDSTGYIATIGDFIEDGGLLFSNGSYKSGGYCGSIGRATTNYGPHRRQFSFWGEDDETIGDGCDDYDDLEDL